MARFEESHNHLELIIKIIIIKTIVMHSSGPPSRHYSFIVPVYERRDETMSGIFALDMFVYVCKHISLKAGRFCAVPPVQNPPLSDRNPALRERFSIRYI